jgi:hypothetical protein
VESLPSKRRILEKKKKREKGREKGKRSKDWKAKVVKPHMKKLHVSKGEKKKKEDEIYKLLGEILSKERKEITFFYSAKPDVWPHPYPHIICICTTFYSFTFPFLTPIHYTILHQPWLFATQTL